MIPLSVERLREIVLYDAGSGKFFRLTASRKTKVGDVAGWINTHGYRHIRIDGRTYKAHRLAFLYMTGKWPEAEVDHINGDPADNRWINLRPATRSQNCANTRLRKDSRTCMKGAKVHGDKFHAGIRVRGKYMHLGTFDTAHEAHSAYRKAAERGFGPYARFE